MNLEETQYTIARMILEAASRVNVQKQTRKLEIALENKLRRLFKQHSVAFLRGLAKHSSKFKESLADDLLDDLFAKTAPTKQMETAIQSAVETSATNGAQNLVDQLGDVDFDQVFSLKNPRAVEYLENCGAELVSGIDETSKNQLRIILERGAKQGWSYEKLALAIRKEFTDWSRKRARLIAITEIGNAYQRGNLIVGQNLAAAGLKMEKSWLARPNSCPLCLDNQADGWIDVNQEHSSGVMCPGAHPGDRCVELYRRKLNDKS